MRGVGQPQVQPPQRGVQPGQHVAGVAVVGDMVYAADLNGTVHAVGLADGKMKWKLDVGRETKAPGNIYGSPVVQGGKLFVSTCNLGGAAAAKTVVVCIGER